MVIGIQKYLFCSEQDLARTNRCSCGNIRTDHILTYSESLSIDARMPHTQDNYHLHLGYLQRILP